MASRFWVGGGSSTVWNATGNTNWATTSGGANNASVPTTGDDVFFDANSGAGTSNASTAFSLNSLDCAGFTGTLNITFPQTITGSPLRISSGMTYGQSSNTITLTGTCAVTTSGKTMGPITMNGASAAVTFQDDYTSDSALIAAQGTLNMNGKNVSTFSMASTGASTRTVTLGASLTLTGTGTILNLVSGGLTFNKGTCNISATNVTATAITIATAGLTFNDLTIAARLGTVTFTGSPTFGTINLASRFDLLLTSGITLTAADYSITQGAGPAGGRISAVTPGSAATLALLSGSKNLQYLALRDITLSGLTVNPGINLGGCTGTIGVPSPAAIVSVQRGTPF